MFVRNVMFLLGVCFFTQIQAFPCYITMVKDNCWTNYALHVDVIDVTNEKVVTTFVIPAGKSWQRQEFACEPKQTVMFKATFSPVIWEKDADKVYAIKRYWSFPEEIKSGETAWNMTICYADAFSGVPLPPEATGQCACDVKSIPPVAPT